MFDPGRQVQADGAHVADDLVLGFLEGQVEAALALPADGVGEIGRERSLAGAGGARDQDAAAPVIPLASQHAIQAGDTGGDPLAANLVIQAQGGEGQDGKAILSYQEGVFIGAVQGAPVFDEPQDTGGDLVYHPVVQEQHRIGNVFLDAVAGQGAFAALSGDYRGDALLLQPAEEAAQFGAQDQLVGEPREQRLHRVQHHPFGSDGVDGVPQADEEALEVVLASLFDVAALDIDELHGQQLFILQLQQIETQGGHVFCQFLRGFLKGHEDAGLVVIDGPPHHELHGQQGLAAAGAAAHQGGPPPGQAAAGDLVQALDACRALG